MAFNRNLKERLKLGYLELERFRPRRRVLIFWNNSKEAFSGSKCLVVCLRVQPDVTRGSEPPGDSRGQLPQPMCKRSSQSPWNLFRDTLLRTISSNSPTYRNCPGNLLKMHIPAPHLQRCQASGPGLGPSAHLEEFRFA